MIYKSINRRIFFSKTVAYIAISDFTEIIGILKKEREIHNKMYLIIW